MNKRNRKRIDVAIKPVEVEKTETLEESNRKKERPETPSALPFVSVDVNEENAAKSDGLK